MWQNQKTKISKKEDNKTQKKIPKKNTKPIVLKKMNRNTHHFEKIKSNAQPKVDIKKKPQRKATRQKIWQLQDGKNEFFYKYQKRREIKNEKNEKRTGKHYIVWTNINTKREMHNPMHSFTN